MQLWLKACAFALLAQQALAYPSPGIVYHNITENLFDLSLHKRQDQGPPPKLRILPLGASITNGLKSTDECGYRKVLREALRLAGYEVDMVGSRVAGLNFNDNHNEGWDGFTIKQVHEKAVPNYRVKPNLVLINAGTNNCRLSEEAAFADGLQEMESMVLDIFNNIDGVTIVLSGLFPNRDKPYCNKVLNDGYGVLVERLARDGRKIVFADLYTDWVELIDGTHPTDEGYKRLAALWFQAIGQARSQNFLTEPLDNGIGSGEEVDAVCDKRPGEYDLSAKTQRGSGADDGPYKHKGVAEGKVVTITPVKVDDLGQNIFFAKIHGRVLSSLIWYDDPDRQKGKFRVYRDWSIGSTEYIEIDVNDPCKPEGVRWGDVNGDGLDDFICIGPEGNMYVSLQNTNGGGPTFTYLGENMKNPRAGSSQKHVRLGDIDGDGRLDYCLIAGNGDISCWRNGGLKSLAEYWQPLGVVFTGKNKGNIEGVRLVDINGDHRADWLYVNDDGSVDTYINNRGHDKSLRPDWQNAGRTHAGMDERGAREYVLFSGRENGGADYIWLDPKRIGGSLTRMGVDVHRWVNRGSGGTMLKADGNHYCDMTGDGTDDYIWVSRAGNMQIFRNIGDPPNWGQHGWYRIKEWDRQLIRIADIDGDGKCDLIYIDSAGVVQQWFKTEYSNGQFVFWAQGPRLRMGACKESNGVGHFDLAVRFADLNGDGKADKLCIAKDGRTSAYISTAGEDYIDYGQVKKPEGADRANLRFVDINGDGKADMLWLDKFGGKTKVWYNDKMEPAPDTNSNMIWIPGGEAYLQSARGECIHYAHLRSKGRADMIDANPRTNEATTWFSTPCGGGGGMGGGDGPDELRDQLPSVPDELQPPSGGGPPEGNGDDNEIIPEPVPHPPAVGTQTPFPLFPQFIALGDSYSAGVGAGSRVRDDYDRVGNCHKNEGAYPHQLWKAHSDLQVYDRKFAFLSCTAAKAENLHKGGTVQFENLQRTQIDLLGLIPGNEYAWGTLSIGGNDLSFGPIATWCLYLPFGSSRCRTFLDKAWRLLKKDKPDYDPQFSINVKRVYTEILDTATTSGFTLIVTGYARFFNAETDHCDTERLLPILNSPRLNKDLRREMNNMVAEVNKVLGELVDEVYNEYKDREVPKYIRFYDIDQNFEGHRICDPGHASVRNDHWFYTPYHNPEDRPNPDASLNPRSDEQGNFNIYDLFPVDYSQCPPAGTELDTEHGTECHLLRQLDPGPDAYPGIAPRDFDTSRQWLKQMMHPKWVAHTATMNGITANWYNTWGSFVPGVPPRPA
ncbi:SGNH hydrolase-type esterase domain-containing protein [Aspergillus karnatakaensis]|uniref:SGNH hydrolase-type esterase domain-containing protein n=1 Tax=Aspergillus karnatakaensis TaxID=1810916 RepID=UPI003CCD5520